MGRTSMQAAAGILGVVAMAGAAWGGPLHPEWVAPDSTWVVHLDAEALAASQIGGAALAHGAMIAIDELEELHEHIGIDATKDIFGVTAFGVDEDEASFTVILEATSVIDDVLAKAPEQMGAAYRNITEGDKTIHAWKDDNKEFFAYVKNSAAPDRRLVLVSMDLLRLRDGMMRLEARAPGANVAQPLAASRPGAGSIIFLSSNTFPGMDDDDGPAAAVMQNAKGVVIDIGEVGGQLRATGELDLGDAETATNVLSMAQGLIAVGRMAAGSEPELKSAMPIFNALQISANGSVLRASLQYDSAAIVQLIESDVHGMHDHDGNAEDGEHHEHTHVNKSLRSLHHGSQTQQ